MWHHSCATVPVHIGYQLLGSSIAVLVKTITCTIPSSTADHADEPSVVRHGNKTLTCCFWLVSRPSRSSRPATARDMMASTTR
jgi:hypothetical protein